MDICNPYVDASTPFFLNAIPLTTVMAIYQL